ncbi:hypothetical protein AAJ76_1410001245 [Vairimorpha ceranae]|uniref:Uncharacterized protein n=1 Tax=Vairimorpha ceranae TaxID=40302 RepID=A0A0F9Z7U3_9MICR|nr:hypothetical protein AAJ76_1410001245 [Vairimorpha ceranae]KKO74009.1 hypothetical protein AAJ76_1410001245 [Vairimorpha ceranae]
MGPLMFFRMKHKYIPKQNRTSGHLNSSNNDQSKRVFNRPYLVLRSYFHQQESVIENFVSTSQLPVNIFTHL